MRICLMIEGQEDVSWDEWSALARACEDNGLEGLFRSDHYTSVRGQMYNGSLDAWATLTALGAVTERIRLGTCVSPASFRHPSVLAKCVTTADHVSGGRVELGMGAGWSEVEHLAYGFPFHDTRTRMEILSEQIEIVHRQWTEEVFSFEGRHYSLSELRALHKPVQRPHPPLIVGGSAKPKTARLAALWADEYNILTPSPDECRAARERLEIAWSDADRDPGELRLSVMTGCVVGADRTELLERVGRRLDKTDESNDPEGWLRQEAGGQVVGTVDEVGTHLTAMKDAGVDRVMLQHLDHSDLDMVALIGRELVPALA
ncbi:MAG: TIGR03560 family F420-dependent LLM class oxidoreductase [Actinobacteria bacterium]|nr:TIGR03560 family F420-dependent LLM class oxidoreductase [Actinomycetota bacterium]MDQ3532164.1 TIGR03560 family F420-dependent LLM class oxidoreductase [Actinomycetota bacterium]